jgi:hypothetical protein
MKDFFEKLNTIQADSKPLFGKMTAQHMVEHLELILHYSNGTRKAVLLTPQEKLGVMKDFLMSDKELTQGFRSPFLPQDGSLPGLNHTDIETAKKALLHTWNNFESYFGSNSGIKEMNPFFGELNYEEWIRFHKKHFTHHFKQFGLL